MKVLLVDDHPLMLAALESVISDLGRDFDVSSVGSAALARERLSQGDDIDLVLLDLNLGDANGFEVLAEWRRVFPALPVVVVSATERREDVVRAIDLGAMGFVPKRSSKAVFAQALDLVMSGGIYVPDLEQDSTWNRSDMLNPLRSAGHSDGPLFPTSPPLESLALTPRQTDVLARLLHGKPNKVIARELNLSVETVKDHVAAVLRALGENSRTQAVLAVSHMMQKSGGVQSWRSPT